MARYRYLEEAGILRIYTARLDSLLVGYAVFFVNTNAHYQGSLQADLDILFVDPDYRKSRIFANLKRFFHDQLRAEGVQVVHQHVKIAHPALGIILEHDDDYEPVEKLYSKRLDR